MTAPLDECLRERLAWAIANEGCIHTGGVDETAITGCRDCERITDAAMPVVTEAVQQARAEVWDEAVQALAWAQDNGPSDGALTYVAKNNPYALAEPEGSDR